MATLSDNHFSVNPFDWIEKVFGYDWTPVQLDFPAILVGDTLTDGEVTVEVLAQGECPYVCPPAIYADYDLDNWSYVYCEETGEVEWLPTACLIEALVTDDMVLQ